MNKFLVSYLAPASVIDDWKKTEPEKRKAAEEKMHAEWRKGMSDHTTLLPRPRGRMATHAHGRRPATVSDACAIERRRVAAFPRRFQ